MPQDIPADIRRFSSSAKAAAKSYVKAKKVLAVKCSTEINSFCIDLHPLEGVTTIKQMESVIKEVTASIEALGATFETAYPVIKNGLIWDAPKPKHEEIAYATLVFRRPRSHSIWIATQCLVRGLPEVYITDKELMIKARYALHDFLLKNDPCKDTRG